MTPVQPRRLYLDLLKRTLTGMVYQSPPLDVPWMAPGLPYHEQVRIDGSDWPSVGHTMIGLRRLGHLEYCVLTVLAEGIPGDLIECLPGNTLVSVPAGRTMRAMRRPYAGPLIEVTTASGNQLSATSNHPVLTRRGWITAEGIQEGDYVVSRARLERMGFCNPDIDDVPAPVSEVFHAAQRGLRQRGPLPPVDLDVRGYMSCRMEAEKGIQQARRQVQVVGTFSNLAQSTAATLSKPGRQFFFPSPYLSQAALSRQGLALHVARLPGHTTLGSRAEGQRLTEAGIVLHAKGHGLARSSRGMPGTSYSPVDSGLVNAVLNGKPGGRLSREIADDRVVSIRTTPYRGHVYNLQTTTGQYLASNIIVHNCGVWRGGACILMRAILEVEGVPDRKVWVADSFQGLPRDSDGNELLAVPQAEVEANFRAYGLLDGQVGFIPGWFSESLPGPVKELAVLRLDGDQYESQLPALERLYPLLSSGGFVIIDDWPGINETVRAVADYRDRHGITTAIQQAGAAGWWRKE